MRGGPCPLNVCRFFREVEGFHNWLYYAYLESFRRVTYEGYDNNKRPKVHRSGLLGKTVSYVMQGDKKCQLSFFVIIKWGHT